VRGGGGRGGWALPGVPSPETRRPGDDGKAAMTKVHSGGGVGCGEMRHGRGCLL
jgi:hypothetical protein